MSIFPLSSHHYRAFVLAKLVRDGILLDVIEHNGFAFAKQLPDQSFATALSRKFLEELDETYADKNNKVKYLHELADIYEITQLAIKRFGTQLAFQLPEKHFHVRTIWIEFERKLRQNSQALSEETLAKLQHAVSATLQYLPLAWAKKIGNLTLRNDFEPLIAVAGAKRSEKGPHNGWYAEVIILPRADEWCAYFGEKFPEISPEMLNPAMAITPDDIHRHLQR